MKKILILIASAFMSAGVFAQEIGHFQQMKTVRRGDTLDVAYYYKPDTTKDIRTFQIDFQFKKQLFTYLSTTVDGGISTMTPAVSFKKFDDYKYSSYNSSTGIYSYTSDTNWTVGRNYLVLSSGSKITSNGYIVHNKFIINNVVPNFAADSITVNWARMFKLDGTTIGDNVATLDYQKMHIELMGNLVISGKVWLGPSMTILPKVICTKASTGAFISESQCDSTGNYTLINVDKNTKYKLELRFPTDSLAQIRDYAVTISDAVKTYDEYTQTDVNQSFGHLYLKYGLSYLIADINKNGKLDGGDPYSIYASISGLKKIDTSYVINAMSKSDYDSLILSTNQWSLWANHVNGNNYIYDSVGTSNINVDIKYYILGDVDRTYSSPVLDAFGSPIVRAIYKGKFDVTIPNLSAPTGQPLYVPFNVNTNGDMAYGLQFEMKYDNTKVKFEEIVSNFGETPWLQYVTHDESNGTVRFGGMNNQTSGALIGSATPFKLKFSPIGNNDVLTNIYVRKLMDASDNNGDHYNIALTSQVTTLLFKMSPNHSGMDITEITASIRPNPTTGWFEVEVKFPDVNMSVLASIYDTQGRLIKTVGEISGDGMTNVTYKQIDMTASDNGNYFLILNNKQKQITKQFVKV
jgi:hypothetical protein